MLAHAAIGILIGCLTISGCNPIATDKPSAREMAPQNPPPAGTSEASVRTPPPNPRPVNDGAKLTLLTYNVLATPVFTELRTEAILAILEASDADIIALQEVGDWFLRALAVAPWVRDRYHLTEQDGQPYAPGGQLIMAKQPLGPVKVMVMPGRQQRVLMIAEVRVRGRAMAIATSHMESFLDDGPVRALQLDGTFAQLRDAEEAVLMGDLNFGDGAKPETEHIDSAYVDVWSTLRPDEPGFTWNMPVNPLAQIGAFTSEPNRRLDWILVRSAFWRADSVTIIGDRPAGRRYLEPTQRAMIEMPDRARPDRPGEEIEVFPSDHFGLRAVLLPR